MIWRRCVAVAAGLLVACTGEQPDLLTNTRDSAGIRIVENPELAPDSTEWTLDSIPAQVIGNEEMGAEHIFSRIGGAVRLSDGRIAVADTRAADVRVFDGSGQLVSRFGGRGSGPGEFAYIVALYRLPGDTLVVQNLYDRGPLGFFTPDGALARTIQQVTFVSADSARPYGSTRASGIFADGTLLGVSRFPGSRPRTSSADGRPQTMVDSALILRGTPGDRPTAEYGVHVIGRSEYYLQEDPRASGFTHGFALPQPSLAVHGTELYYASGESFEVLVYDGSGKLTRIIRKKHTPVPIPRAWADSAAQHVLDLIGSQVPWLANVPAPTPPPFAPAIDHLTVDDDGNLWVLSNHPDRSPASAVWHVFDSAGVLRHRLRTSLTPSHIGSDFWLAIFPDADGVQLVGLFPLVKR
jgi:hypothetical protein